MILRINNEVSLYGKPSEVNIMILPLLRSVAAWCLIFFFFGCSYSTAGYVDLPDVFKVGFIMAVINTIIWGVVGAFWWKFLGLY